MASEKHKDDFAVFNDDSSAISHTIDIDIYPLLVRQLFFKTLTGTLSNGLWQTLPLPRLVKQLGHSYYPCLHEVCVEDHRGEALSEY